MLLGIRPEEQDVGPKATDIMSGVFEVFVNLTQVLAGNPNFPKEKARRQGIAGRGNALSGRYKKGLSICLDKSFCSAYGNRTRVPCVRGMCPSR